MKRIWDKIEVSGMAVLFIGIALLTFTFVSAYMLLIADLGIIASRDLAQVFGQTLAPLIATCIRIMYLGVMGWIGSLLTIRGITIITQFKAQAVITQQTQTQPIQTVQPQAQKQAQPKQLPKTQKIKEEEKAKPMPPPQPEPEPTPTPPPEPQKEPSEVVLLPEPAEQQQRETEPSSQQQ